MIETVKSIFTHHFGIKPDTIVQLKGDASTRQIYRLKYADKSIIGIYGPNKAENRAFLAFTYSFHNIGLPVPQILYSDEEAGIYFLKDLGDETLFSRLNRLRNENSGIFPRRQVENYYHQALEYLARFQIKGAEIIDFSLCYQTSAFDYDAWKIDHDYFLNCFIDIFVPQAVSRQALEETLKAHREMLEPFTGGLFLYRDFQSRNIMLMEDQLYFLDYQSGRRGHPCYDLASLIYDARADLPDDFRQELMELLLRRISSETYISTNEMREAFPLFALLRILQALASYGNNGVKKGRTEYLTAIPYALENALNLLEDNPALKKLTALYDVLTEIKNSKF